MRSNNQFSTTMVVIVAVAVSLVFVNLLAVRQFFRIDLTRDNKYTLSPASKDTMKNLPDVMTVTAYFTEGLPPPYSSYSRYVRDMLEEYRSSSKGKFSFEFIDPSFSETAADKEKKKEAGRDIFGRVTREPTSVEKELNGLGVQPVEIRVIEDDQQQQKRAYLGLVFHYQGKQEVIPVVQDIQNLEKDVTSLMRKLTRTKTPVVGIAQSPHVTGTSKLRNLLNDGFTIKDIDLSKKDALDGDIDALLLIGGSDTLSDEGIAAIQTFAKNGKSVAFLMDRYSIDSQTFQARPADGTPGMQKLFDLLKTYGFTVSDQLVADARCATLSVSEQRGGMMINMPLPYPFIPELYNLDQDSPVTRGLTGVMLPFVSKVEAEAPKGMEKTVLASSSKASWLEPKPPNMSPRRDWRKESVQPKGPYPLIASTRGKLSTDDKDAKETRFLVAGTSAFVWDQFINESNQALAMNLVDWLLADSALLAMRTRDFVDTPLNPDLSDGVKLGVKYANVLGVPLLLILYGLMRWRMREARRTQVST